MKVERAKQVEEYLPIIIKTETREEERLLWHLMNCGQGMPLGKYCRDHDINEEKMYKLTYDIYTKLDAC